jgi:hypothetical protein
MSLAAVKVKAKNGAMTLKTAKHFLNIEETILGNECSKWLMNLVAQVFLLCTFFSTSAQWHQT